MLPEEPRTLWVFSIDPVAFVCMDSLLKESLGWDAIPSRVDADGDTRLRVVLLNTTDFHGSRPNRTCASLQLRAPARVLAPPSPQIAQVRKDGTNRS